ncbi:MAG: M20/M25/M40 family metallo-hydrolase, partial [Armatimonadota bacterium]|nr:M20/M25/M40 family metallo-hydrolase [Armatimonadota bacterium]
PLVGPPSLHAARLQGGTELSVYAARCTLQVERRTVPGETPEDALAEAETILRRLSAADPTFRGNARILLARSPFEVPPHAEIVRTVRTAAAHVLGTTPPDYGQAWWTDAALLAAAGVETVMFGPTGGGAHTPQEWVDLQSLVNLAQVLAETARAYCA